jgi:hypothetical protein
MVSVRCMADNQMGISKYIFCSMSFLVIISSVILALTSLVVFISLYRYEFPNKNRKILIWLMLTNLVICVIYFINEFVKIAHFDKVENFFRDCLFFICFLYFFQNMLYISKQKKIVFWIIMSMILIIQILSLIQLIMRIFYDSICNIFFFEIKIILGTISIFVFLFLSNSWIQNLIDDCFAELNKNVKKENRNTNTLIFINKNNLIKRLLKFKILVYVYFFAQIYNLIKAVFYSLLNKNAYNNDNVCLSLYGPEKEMIFYDYFDQELEFFKTVELGEYFFRIVFCFAIPIFVVFIILKSEYNYIKEICSHSSSNNSKNKNNSDDFVQGLNFKYDDS